MRWMRYGWVWVAVLAVLLGWAVTPTLADDEPPTAEEPKDFDDEDTDEGDEGTEEEGEEGSEEEEEAADDKGGELALSWTAKAFINSEELTLEGLRGKLVFVEYFGTG